MPYVVLRNKAAKCFKIEDIKPDTLLLVHYHTPGKHNASQMKGLSFETLKTRV
jgi:hypothetical protein